VVLKVAHVGLLERAAWEFRRFLQKIGEPGTAYRGGQDFGEGATVLSAAKRLQSNTAGYTRIRPEAAVERRALESPAPRRNSARRAPYLQSFVRHPGDANGGSVIDKPFGALPDGRTIPGSHADIR